MLLTNLNIVVCALILAICGSWAAAAASRDINDAARLTVIYDAFGRDPRLKKDWGYAALIEIGGRRILFDTGNDPIIFAQNVKALNIDLTTIDFAVISHRHTDHTSGISHLLSVNPQILIFAPEEKFGVFGSGLPASFYRRAEGLPAERRYYDGHPPRDLKFGTNWPNATMQLIDKTTEVAPGVHLIALTSEQPGTRDLLELSLAIETQQGLVVVVGCSHPGILRIIEAATTIDARIHMVAGGLHFPNASDALVEEMVSGLKDRFHVNWMAPGHCTGEPAFLAISKSFGDRSVFAGLGQVIGLGTNPRAGIRPGDTGRMTPSDFAAYREFRREMLIRLGGRVPTSRGRSAATPINF